MGRAPVVCWRSLRFQPISPIDRIHLIKRTNETASASGTAGVSLISAQVSTTWSAGQETVPNQIRDHMNKEPDIDILLAPHSDRSFDSVLTRVLAGFYIAFTLNLRRKIKSYAKFVDGKTPYLMRSTSV